MDAAVVAEDRQPDPDRARLRNPEHQFADLDAGQVERLLRAGHVGRDRGRLAAEQFQRRCLQGLRAHAERAEQAERDNRLARVLQFAHAGSDPLEATQGIGFADRQLEENQAEMVSELLGVFERAQVDRHGRANGHAIDVFAAIAQVAAQRAAGAGEQDIVDRAAERASERLYFLERHRIGPGDALDDAERALE